MTRYALRFRDGTIQVRRVADDQEVARFHARGDREVVVFRFSPDGRYLATNHYPDYGVTVWDVERGSVAIDDAGPLVVGGGQVQPGQPPDRRRPSRGRTRHLRSGDGSARAAVAHPGCEISGL